MNFYVIVEGKAERRIYADWIPYVNPKLTQIHEVDHVIKNSFFLISGGGYPQYYDVVTAAIEDVNHYHDYDRLVISIDSEDMTFDQKLNEVNQYVSTRHCRIPIHMVIQHFCFETWALGNRAVVRANPRLPRLLRYRSIFNVRNSDPELLPANPAEGLNRSQFAERYLRTVLNDRFRNLTYSKSNPQPLLHPNYYNQLRLRFQSTGHIPSFWQFLTAFR